MTNHAYRVTIIGYGPIDGDRIISALSEKDALTVARRFLGYANVDFWSVETLEGVVTWTAPGGKQAISAVRATLIKDKDVEHRAPQWGPPANVRITHYD
ncbi:MAG: hypothetical protein ABL951_02710 [Alphaproteobacteria bacterium]